MNYRVTMKVLITIILGMIPVMLGASDRFADDSFFLNRDSLFLIAKSDTTDGGNNNMTIVFPAGEDDQEESPEVERDNKPAEAGTWKKGLEFETNFNTKDWMMGLGLGMQHSSGIALLLRFQIRPLTNTVFVEKSASVYRQYNERRMVLGLSASWDYMIVQPFGIYINAGYGVSFAYFRGSDNNPETIWTPMTGGGLLLQPWETTSLRFGYEYIRTPEYPNHHINISAMLMF